MRGTRRVWPVQSLISPNTGALAQSVVDGLRKYTSSACVVLEKETPVAMGPIKLGAPLGVGCWAWGDSAVWGYNSSDFTQKAVEEAYVYLMDNGITFFDTAELYGRGLSETILGGLHAKYAHRYETKPTIIASKFLPLPWRVRSHSLKDALKASLNRLRVGSIALYQIHSPTFSVRNLEVWAEAMAEVFKEGLIKAVGVSNYNRAQVLRTHSILAKYGIPLASNQIEFSLARADPDKNGTLQACRDLNVSVIAYSPLAMGALTGKYSAAHPPSNLFRSLQYPMKKMDTIISKLRTIEQRTGKTPAQIAINWCICKGTIPIVGVKSAKQAEANLGALGWRLAKEEIATLDEAALTKGFRIWQADSRG